MLCLAGIGQMQTERLEASPELTSKQSSWRETAPLDTSVSFSKHSHL